MIHSHGYIGIEDLKYHILVKWHNMVTKVLMIKGFKPGLLFCHIIDLEIHNLIFSSTLYILHISKYTK